jgi:hypothetical protein
VSKEKKRSWVARELSKPKYRPKVERNKDKYDRKKEKYHDE